MVNVIARLEFELADFEATVQYFNHWDSPIDNGIYTLNLDKVS